MTDITKGLAFCLGYGEKRTPSLPLQQLQQLAFETGNNVLSTKLKPETADSPIDNTLSSGSIIQDRANLASDLIDSTSLSSE
jgi:hypothetical protein